MNDTTTTILRSSAGADPKWRHTGGGRRAAQIEEILTRGGYSWIDSFESPLSSRFQLAGAYLRLRFKQPRIKTRLQRRMIGYLANDYLRYRHYFSQPNGAKVFLLESCIDYARMRAAHDMGIGMICLPMNLEVWQQSVARDFYSGEGLPQCLHREAVFTSLGDVVFCISREEQWFLRNYGANADYLPYHPPAAELARLGEIRAARLANPPASNDFFTITTASNEKNRDGLIALARLVSSLPASANFRLHVGGFQTEDLQGEFPSDRCTFHGPVDEAKVRDLMLRCKGAIVFQPSGTGALTRIPELLCAGIPVLANPHAARSVYHLPGVHLFHDGADLLNKAAATMAMPPMPEPDRAAEERLLGWLKQLNGRAKIPQ